MMLAVGIVVVLPRTRYAVTNKPSPDTVIREYHGTGYT